MAEDQDDMGSQRPPTPSPHNWPWNWKLFQYFRRVSRPVGVEPDNDDLTSEQKVREWWHNQFQLTSDRKERYKVFRQMEEFDLIGAVLDAYSEECTQKDYDTGRSIWIESRHPQMVKAGDVCLRNLQAEDRITAITRGVSQYGDGFKQLIYQSGKGVLGWKHSDPDKVHRRENKYDRLIGFAEDGKTFRQRKHPISWPWDYVHFRLLGKDEKSIYGTSLLAPMFRSWRQLCILGSTLVWTARGPIQVKDLQPGELVYCHDPIRENTYKTECVAVLPMGKQRILRVQTKHRQIFVTENHGLMVKQANGQFNYKKAKEIIPSGGVGRLNWFGYKNHDKLVLPRVCTGMDTHTVRLDPEKYRVTLQQPAMRGSGVMSRIRECELFATDKNAHAFLGGARDIAFADHQVLQEEFGGLAIATISHVGSRKAAAKLNDDLSFTGDHRFGRLFGFMLGDGWLRKNGTGFALGEYPELNEYYLDLYEEVMGIRPVPCGDAIEGSRGGAVADHSIVSKDIFEAFGFITGFAKRVIPAWVFGMSQEFKRELLQGLFDADAGEQSGGWRLSLANRALIDGAVMLAQQVGYNVSREVEVINREGRQQAYRIYVSPGKDQDAPVVYEPVTHIDYVGEGETYDLTVADPLHNFVADGIVSHNTLAEDSTLMYRLKRTPTRAAFFVDIMDLDEQEGMEYVNKFRKAYNKSELIDPVSARYKKDYNPITPREDIFLPMRANSGTRIDAIPGAGDVGEINDLEWFRKKFSGVSRIPGAYLGFPGEDIDAKATLMQLDVRFARMLKRLQKSIIYGFRATLDIHYTLLDHGSSGSSQISEGDMPRTDDKYDIVQFPYVVKMSPISYLDEFERLQLIEMRQQMVEGAAGLAQSLQIDPRAWTIFVLLNYAKLPEKQIQLLLAKAQALTPTPGQPGVPSSFESLSPRAKQYLREKGVDPSVLNEAIGPQGYYSISINEQEVIKTIVAGNPLLRTVVEGFAGRELEEASQLQCDSSLSPVFYIREGKLERLEDDFVDDPESKILQEHLKG